MHGGDHEEQTERQALAAWRTLKTGARADYNSVQRDARGFPLFVPATHLSDGWDQFRDAKDGDGGKGSDGSEDTDAHLEDIFSDHGAVTSKQRSSAVEPTCIPGDEKRGRAVASFYSQLPRDGPDTCRGPKGGTSQPLTTEVIPHRHTKPRSEWFIRRASVQIREEKLRGRRDDAERCELAAGEVDSANKCTRCLSALPSPLSASAWEAHRLSIAHQLALEGPRGPQPVDSLTRSKRKAGGLKGVEPVGRVILEASNLGYAALERMGWRRGMGLGKEDWEYGRRLGQRLGREQEMGQQAIEISDSEDDEAHFEIGGEDWLSRIREQEQARLAAVRPIAVGGEDACVPDDEPAVPRQRPLLEPIAVALRPDRRGIGNTLPRSSRLADKKSSQSSKERANGKQQGSEKATKRERRERERREREAWKELRSSLN